MRHFVIVALLIAVLTPLIYFGLDASHVMPIEASAQAVPVDWMWNMDMGAISFLFALVMVPLIYALIVFRRRKGEVGDAEPGTDSKTLEVTWTVIPLVLVTVFAYLGAYSLGETRIVAPNAMEVGVTAHQWDWSFTYPGGFTSNELHLPLNRQVVLKMQSLDVIHSFWVPEFRVKQDVVPGRTTELRITPTRIGEYQVRCAELCGASHTYMIRPVIVSSESSYEAWVKDQTAAAAALLAQGGPAAGQALASQSGCAACHSLDGSKLTGPTWRGLFGSKVTLADGSTVTADEAYLTQSILDPNAKVVQGFQAGIMPKFALTDDQVKFVVAYLETLK
jgi:cytochrome c oxidase subunit 2